MAGKTKPTLRDGGMSIFHRSGADATDSRTGGVAGQVLTTLAALAAALALTVPAAMPAAAAPAGSGPAAGGAVDGAVGRYLVQTHAAPLPGAAANAVAAAGGRVNHTYARAFSGYSASLTAGQAQSLAKDPRVKSVIPDKPTRAAAIETNPPWGLDRIDQRTTAGDGAYHYDTTGAGVTVFVVDTGVRRTHVEFGGRVSGGYDFVDRDTDASDCAGHGSHVAGTIGGATYGVAKAVKYVSLRVWDCNSSGYYSDMIAALDWVIANKPAGPSVVNISGGGGAFAPMNEAVQRTVAAGVPVVVAAMNDNADSCGSSPSSTPEAITVGATDSTDRRAYFSDFGPCVDLFAPGVGVLSAVNSSDTASEFYDGTSMATPHVTGIAARYLQSHPTATPAQVAAALLAAATPNIVTDPMGSPNRLAYIGLAPAVPGAPTAFTAAKNDAAKTATITWAPPSNTGGSAITGYRVSRDGTDAKGVGPWSAVVPATARTQSFIDLRPGGSYNLSVQAITAAGTGTAATGRVSMLALPGRAVIGTAAGGVTTDAVVSVTANWLPPTSGGTVAGYTVTAINQATGARTSVTTAASARTRQLTGLTSGASYAIEVRAKNASGSGAASARSNVVQAR